MAAPPLTPATALDYLRELSIDIRAAVVMDAEGELAASTLDEPGAQRMRDHAAQLLAQADAADDAEVAHVEVATGAATVYAVRGERWTIAVVASRAALSSLMLFDLRHVLGDLG